MPGFGASRVKQVMHALLTKNDAAAANVPEHPRVRNVLDYYSAGC
jgi:hypothetical protein